MQLSIVSTLLLAQGIVAMPWSSVKAKQSNGGEITLHIQVSQGSSASLGLTPKPKEVLNANNYDICWRACFGQSPNCPETWKAKNLGTDDEPCWTCCKSTGDDDDL
ncbi:hypothetical protein FSARC_13440 [Fusarium sarcochroum]|uniref:Pathogenicity protein n=1 Tax=Fusarium sarcochroum TaxID=1208366 RepID=A0A8H4T1F6_9HYPO|nr:hypothetical protein FSARC_13440 [Fusarium sarcochroum]